LLYGQYISFLFYLLSFFLLFLDNMQH